MHLSFYLHKYYKFNEICLPELQKLLFIQSTSVEVINSVAGLGKPFALDQNRTTFPAVYTTHCHTSGDVAVVVVQSAWMDEWIPESPLAARQASIWGAWPGLVPIVAAVAVLLLLPLLPLSLLDSTRVVVFVFLLLFVVDAGWSCRSHLSACEEGSKSSSFFWIPHFPVEFCVGWSAWLVAVGMLMLLCHLCLIIFACNWQLSSGAPAHDQAMSPHRSCTLSIYFVFFFFFSWEVFVLAAAICRPSIWSAALMPNLCCISWGA